MTVSEVRDTLRKLALYLSESETRSRLLGQKVVVFPLEGAQAMTNDIMQAVMYLESTVGGGAGPPPAGTPASSNGNNLASISREFIDKFMAETNAQIAEARKTNEENRVRIAESNKQIAEATERMRQEVLKMQGGNTPTPSPPMP